MRQEARVWKQLNHRNVLRFLGLVELDCEIYLVSQWMEYGDLANFVKERLLFLEGPPAIAGPAPKVRIAWTEVAACHSPLGFSLS